MAIYILTDSTADFTPEEAERRRIWVVPLKVQFGEEEFPNVLDHAAFFRRLAEAKELPTRRCRTIFSLILSVPRRGGTV